MTASYIAWGMFLNGLAAAQNPGAGFPPAPGASYGTQPYEGAHVASAAAFYASFGTPAPSAVGGSESAPAETFQTSKQVGFSTSYGPEGTYSTSSTVPAETSPTGIQTGSTETQSASTTAIESANPTNTSSPQKEEVAAGVFYDNLGLNPTGFSGKPYNQPYPHQFAGTATAPYPFPGTGSAGLPYTPSYAVGTAGLKSPYSGEAYNHELESGNHASAAAAASRSFAALYPNDHLGNGHRNGVAPTATAAAAKDVKDVVAGVGPYQAGGTGGVVTGVGPYHAVETGGGGAYRQAVGTGGLAEDTYRGVVGTSGAVYHHHLGEATGTGGLAAAAAETGGYYHQVGHEKRNLFPRDEEAVDLEDSTGDDSTVEDPETDDEAADSGSDATVGGRSAVATFALVVCGIAAMLA